MPSLDSLSSFRTFVTAFLTFACLAQIPASASAEGDVESRVVAPANALSFQIGPGGRVAAVVRQGSRVAVSVDGEVGEAFDRLLGAGGRPMLGRVKFPPPTDDHPVIFSPDGARFAYVGLQGGEYAVIIDGKEVHRAKYIANALEPDPTIVRFSPTGRRYWFVANDAEPPNLRFLYMDGKREPEPIQIGAVTPAFSADDRHYAYATRFDVSANDTWKLVIDGKVASYQAYAPTFLPNGKLVTVTKAPAGSQRLLIDGKDSGPGNIRYEVSAANRVATIQPEGIVLDGKLLPGTAGAESLVFSPDGKRLASAGVDQGGAGPRWVWVDGVKSPGYLGFVQLGPKLRHGQLNVVAFSADSSKAYAIANNAGMHFLVINGKETLHAYKNITPVVAREGGRLAFTAYDESGTTYCVIDDEVFTGPGWRTGGGFRTPGVVRDSLAFSPDGGRSYFLENGPNPVHVLDGKPVDLGGLGASPWTSPNTGPLVYGLFSSDGKRFSYVGSERMRGGNRYWVFVDSKPLASHENGTRTHPMFTPDGRHLFWINRERSQGRPGMDHVVYHNGRPVLRVNYQTPLGAELAKQAHFLHLRNDGTLRLVAESPEGVVLHTLTPDPAYDLDAAVAANVE